MMQTTVETIPGRVLVVDDELLIRWSVSETLADQGFIVSAAPDGRAALRALTSGRDLPDVVLLDFRLPDSNDLTLLSTIRRQSPSTAVIMMTAFGTPEVTQAALALGAYRILPKPFEVHEMADLVLQARASAR